MVIGDTASIPPGIIPGEIGRVEEALQEAGEINELGIDIGVSWVNAGGWPQGRRETRPWEIDGVREVILSLSKDEPEVAQMI